MLTATGDTNVLQWGHIEARSYHMCLEDLVGADLSISFEFEPWSMLMMLPVYWKLAMPSLVSRDVHPLHQADACRFPRRS